VAGGGAHTDGPDRHDEPRRGVLDRVERVLAPVPVLRRVVPVQRRYGDLNGNAPAGSFAFSAFVAVAVVGFVAAHGSTDPVDRIIDALGVTGTRRSRRSRVGGAQPQSDDGGRPVGAVLVGVLVNFGLWVWAFRVPANTRVRWRSLLPGALFGAIGMEVLKAAGAVLVPNMVASSSQRSRVDARGCGVRVAGC
jgi:hypothetical protein